MSVHAPRRSRLSTRTVFLATSTVLLTAASNALAIGGAGAAATPAYPWVGRAQDENTAQGDHIGTGSYIRRGFVLTAGHNSDTDTTNSVYDGFFERFQLPGGTQGFALPIWEPGYNPATLNDNDQALWYVINAPAVASYGQLWDGTQPAGGTFPTAGDAVKVVGFTGSANNGNPLLGTMKVQDPNPGGTGTLITLADNPNFTQGGDSGGPYIANIGGVDVIIASHRSGNAGSTPPPAAGAYRSTGVLVSEPTRRNFLLGDGLGGQRVVDQMTDASSGFFDNGGARWSRGSAGAHTQPQAGDVVILDPTFNSDIGTQIQADIAGTPNLYGLANDVKFLVRSTVPVTGEGGVVNTGQIIADDSAGRLNIGFQFDNPGSLTITSGSVVSVGASIPQHPTKLFSSAMLNASNPNVAGTITVGSGGTLNVHTTAADMGASLRNQVRTVFNVTGGADPAAANIDVLQNEGATTVGAKGTVTVSQFSLLSDGSVTVGGASGSPGAFTSGAIDQSGGTVTVNNFGTLSATRKPLGGGYAAGDSYTLRAGTTLTVNNGGTANVTAGGNAPTGYAMNSVDGGTINLNEGATATFTGKSLINGPLNITTTVTPTTLTIKGQALGDSMFLGGNGVVTLGSNLVRSQITFSDANLTTTGQIRGEGTLFFTGNSSLDNRTVGSLSAQQNSNGTDLIFDDANSGASSVALEAPSEDQGDVLAGLSDKFAYETICIRDNSIVTLHDANDNETSLENEVIYTKYLGVDATSSLNLAGLTIYYEYPDADCGGILGTITEAGGEIIQIPEPSLGLICLPALALIRRRRN